MAHRHLHAGPGGHEDGDVEGAVLLRPIVAVMPVGSHDGPAS
jgi:hypothetical protein